MSIDDRPLAKGGIATTSISGRGATAYIQSDGSFELSTFGKSDGAQLGLHKVAVAAYEGGDSGPEGSLGKSLVPQRYTNPETSGLTIEVPADGLDDVELKLYTKEQK